MTSASVLQPLLDVDRVSFSHITTRAFQEHYESVRKPFIITDMLASMEDWSLETISEALQGGTYPVRIHGREHRTTPKRNWRRFCDSDTQSIDQFATHLRNRTAHEQGMYMAQVALSNTRLGEIIRPSVSAIAQRFHLRPFTDINLWLGPAGHTEPLHLDIAHGTLIQLHGAKSVRLFPPSQDANLYPFPFGGPIGSNFSQVDTDTPDLNAFPNYAEALQHRTEVILQQGEVIFIPAMWWHEITALGNDYVCSVNRFWFPVSA